MKGMTHKETHAMWEEMRKYKAEGHSMGEVAERFGVTTAYAQKTCKGIAPQTNRRPSHYRNQYIRSEPGPEAMKNLEANGFVYIDGYTGCDGFINIKCIACGSVQRSSMVGIRHGDKTICRACRSHAELNRIALEESEKRKREWLARDEAKAKYRQLSFKQCQACGRLFIHESGRRKLYCSDACAKKVEYAKAKDKRLRVLKENMVDRNINLEDLYQRDNGICYLCGQSCNWDDRVITEAGVFIAGDKYPSIDHVVPISKGGKHAWGNVRLACRHCNTMKRDKPALHIAQ